MIAWWRSLVAEARAVFTDLGAVLILVAAVFFYPLVYPVPYRGEVLQDLPIAVVDLERSAMSRQLARMIDAHQLVDVSAHLADRAEAERAVLAGTIAGYIVVPEHFERDLLRGDPVTLPAYLDASYVLAYRQALTGVLEAAGTLSAGVELRRAQARGATAAVAAAQREPFHVATRPLFNATESYATYIVPGVLVLILQQTLLVGMGLVAGTRRERAMAADLPDGTRGGPVARVAGRVTFYVALYGLYSVVYFGVLFAAYGLGRGSDAGQLALFVLPYLLAAACLGDALGHLFDRRETAMYALVWTSLPAVFLSGFAWPLEAAPRWLRAVAQLLPSTAGIDGVLRLTQLGASFAEVASQARTLWILTAGYALAAVLLEAWRGGRRPDECRRGLSA